MTRAITKKFFEEITFFGGIAFFLFLICLLLIFKNYILALRFFLGLVFIYLVTFVIRLFYFKNRPQKLPHSNLLEKIDASSFPSIHTARVTYLLLFVLFQSPLFISPIVKIAVGAVFFLTLYSRIYLSKHDIVDVIAGVTLGIISIATLFIPL